MKVFQVINNICHWDATRQFPTLDSTVGFFPLTDLFVEAPVYVFEGWGYDPDAEGDDRFIQPTPPPGWLYDPNTGTFYPEDYDPTLTPDGDFVMTGTEIMALISEGVNSID